MNEGLPDKPEYKATMERLENAKKTTESGADYWLARDIHSLFGYDVWSKFTPVIERARSSMASNGVNPSHHIARTSKMMGLGRGAQRQVEDFFLTRGACYLVAMNGDPNKPEIAAAQAYFAAAARAHELSTVSEADAKRLDLRQKVTRSFKVVSGVAKEAGVQNSRQALFHDARYQGLYGMSKQEMMAHKGLLANETPFDRMGALELSANDFQMNLAAETIKKEGVRGEANAIRKNKEVASRVRQTMEQSGGRTRENLPAEEPIKVVAKRLNAAKRKAIDGNGA